MGLILRCIDFLARMPRAPARRPAAGWGAELLEELGRLNAVPEPAETPLHAAVTTTAEPPAVAPAAPVTSAIHRDFRITVSFERDLQLVDLKAELVWNRLGEIGEIRRTHRRANWFGLRRRAGCN